MTFSIIVPIYNVEKYLKECIESLINQTYKDFEIILVDDGSPDNSPQICDEYAAKDNRIKVIHKENGGLVSARKAGTSVAVGEYIVCVDGDDCLEVDCLESYNNILKISDIDILCSEYYTYNGVEKEHIKLSICEGLYNKENIEKEIFPILIHDNKGRYFSNSMWAKVYKREIYIKRQNSVDNSIYIGEDAVVTKPIIYDANTLYILKKPLYCYRYNPTSITKGKKVFNWQQPKLRGKHFEKSIDMSKFDFKEQNYRMIVHTLFNVAVSQFNRKDKYSVIAKEIKDNFKDNYYQTAINNCRYNNKKGKLMLFALKHKMVWMFFLFNKIFK